MTKPTCAELLEMHYVREQWGELTHRVERVLALHLPTLALDRCIHCCQQWPCPTVRLLDGED